MLQNHLKRIFKNKVKLLFVVLVFLIPLLSGLDILKNNFVFQLAGSQKPNPQFSTFLAAQQERNFIFHTILMWFLPLYLLVIVGDEGTEDYKTGYRNILIERIGKKKYLLDKMVFSFCFCFVMFFAAMLLNYIVVNVVCYGGKSMIIDPTDSPWNFLYTWGSQHPMVTNIGFMAVTSFFAGLSGSLGSMLSLTLHDRRIVYPLAFLLWFFYDLFTKTSLFYLFQPFTEYGFETLIPLFVNTLLLYVVLIIGMYFWEAKHETI